MSLLGLATKRLLTNKRFASPLTLIKNAAGTYVDQLYVAGAQEAIAIVGSSQAMTDDERQNLEYGERLREGRVFYVKADDKALIRPMRQGDSTNTPGDIIQEGGVNYEVYSVESFYLNGHIKCTAFRQENQPDA